MGRRVVAGERKFSRIPDAQQDERRERGGYGAWLEWYGERRAEQDAAEQAVERRHWRAEHRRGFEELTGGDTHRRSVEGEGQRGEVAWKCVEEAKKDIVSAGFRGWFEDYRRVVMIITPTNP